MSTLVWNLWNLARRVFLALRPAKRRGLNLAGTAAGGAWFCLLSLCHGGIEDRALQGDVSIHDPSTILKCNGRYWVFGTGWGIRCKSSSDLKTWKEGRRVFMEAPVWTTNSVPGNRGYFWAPDVVQAKGRYLLYYSVSTWGSQNSVIGLASNATLDESDPRYKWQDEGAVIRSSPKDDFNAIDPGLFLDREGRLWMVLGSFWSGIKLTQLDPDTGKPAGTTGTMSALAWHTSIEAPCLHQHGNNYYLFVNWGQCCRGTNSTYNIRVGRSLSIHGPYLDRAGTPLLQDGGTLLLETCGRFIGPGHAAILTEQGTNWLSFHYYDGGQKGAPKLGLRELRWDSEGWPFVEAP